MSKPRRPDVRPTRRHFLQLLAATAAAGACRTASAQPPIAGPIQRRGRAPLFPFDWAATGRHLRTRYADLRRHFVFEYYPWYGVDPWRHWTQWDRQPPADIAATAVPRLGPYDSRSRAVMEQHARWIAESGVGAINVSWWGPGSYEDAVVHDLMDVMRDHDIKVTFHLEPYAVDRASRYADDVLHLLREYGEKRRWDAFLLLEDADGRTGPVFKSFNTVLLPESTDCHGVTSPVELYTPDGSWRRQTDRLRETLRSDFDHVRLLADSSDMPRVRASGFDGIAIYDNYVRPSIWREYARICGDHDLVFSFNANAGFDGIHLRNVEPDSCYVPLPFEPPAPDEFDFFRAADREEARLLAQTRINESLRTTLTLQTEAALPNERRGFFLVYVNSFNEWHEGTSFEPMKDYDQLSAEERRHPYRNPAQGDYRLRFLDSLLELLGI